MDRDTKWFLGVLVGCVVVCLLIAVLLNLRGSSSDTSTKAWSPVSGQALTQPEQLTSQDGVLEVDFTPRVREIEVAGSTLKARPYDDALIGPTLNVSPGDTLRVNLTNRTGQRTNIHYHGLHVSPKGKGDNVFRTFEPDKTYESVITLPVDHNPGTYWYHVHYHGNTEEQVAGGMSGLLVVQGLEERLPEALQDIQEVQLPIRDVQTTDGGTSITLEAEDIDPTKPTKRLVNAQLMPRLSMQPGETQLWRIANVGADIFYDIQLQGHKLVVIAEDGYPVWRVTHEDHLLLPPGKRFDVLVTAKKQGSYKLLTRHYDEGFQHLPRTDLATLEVAGEELTPAKMPSSLSAEASLEDASVSKRRAFTFSLTEKGPFKAEINGEVFDPNKINVTPVLGTVEEWTLKNTSTEDHPFHIHVNDFQVMSVNGEPYQARGRQDVVVIPKNGGEVVIRNPFEDFTGEFVFHCHILGHEDAGMMQSVEVVKHAEDGKGAVIDQANVPLEHHDH